MTRVRHHVVEALSRWREFSHLLWIGAILIGLETLYVFYGSAGRMSEQWPIYQTYYDMLAEGFRDGHLYLDYTPRPELLAAEDPWAMKHYRLWLVDATFYGGKYYIYWGPVPALIQAWVKSVLGVDRIIGDQYVAFVSFSVLTFSSCVLLFKMAKRLFPVVPTWLIALSLITVGCANPVPHLVSTGGVYQGAIASGQALMITGLLFAFNAVWHSHCSERAWPHLACAGVAWGVALGCRFSHAPMVGLLGLGSVLAVHWCRSSDPQEAGSDESGEPAQDTPRSDSGFAAALRSFAVHSCAIGTPVLICVAALLVYNKLRFDEFLEFGTTWMTTSLKFAWTSKFLPANIYAYLLQDFQFDARFPYLHQMTHFGKNGIPAWIEFPEGLIMDEPHVGIFKSAPITWLGLVGLLVVFRKSLSARLRSFSSHDRLYIVHFLAFFILATVGAMPALGVFITTMRYMADFTHGFLLMGVFGGYTLYTLAAEARPALRRRILTIFAGTGVSALALFTIAFGLALGFQGYIGHFERFNPDFYLPLVEQLSFGPPAAHP